MGKVLVVHPKESVRMQLRSILEPDGHDVRYAGDAEAAKAALNGSPYDLIVLAAVLPGQNGLLLTESLSELAGWAPVLVLGEACDPQLEYAEELGAHAVLTLPVSGGQALGTVRVAIAERAPWGWERRVA